MSTTVNYFGTVQAPTVVQLTAANTAMDGTGTAPEIAQGVAAGRRISKIRCANAITGAPAAQRVGIFESLDSGTTKRFLCDVLIPSGSAVAAGVRSQYVEIPEIVGKILVGSTHRLYAASHIAQAVNVITEYEDA
jgi:hypothetical protein